jgi:hypothetical protein
MRVLISLIGFICGVAVTLALIASGLFAPFRPTVANNEWGEFPVPAKVELLDDGRQVKLLEDFVYLDPRGRAWTTSRNTVVDGASIPKAFWTITGGPFEGKYRNASIVHDEACVKMTESWQNVHLMFYEACRCGGVPEYQAKLLYAAVFHFGPKWKFKPLMETRVRIGSDGKEDVITVTKNVADVERWTEDPPDEVRDKLEAFIKGKNPSLADIQSLNLNSL